MKRSEVVDSITKKSMEFINGFRADINGYALMNGLAEREKNLLLVATYAIEDFLTKEHGLREVYNDTGKYILDDTELLVLDTSRYSLAEKVINRVIESPNFESVFHIKEWLTDNYVKVWLIPIIELSAFNKVHEGENLKLEED